MKIAGIAAIIAGVCWIAATAFPLLGGLLHEPDAIRSRYTLPIALLMAVPGALLIWFGAWLFFHLKAQDVKGVAGTVAVFAALYLSFVLDAWLPWPEVFARRSLFWALLLAVILVLPVYMVVAHALLKRAGMETHGHRGLVSRGALYLIAWLVYLSGIGLTRLFFEAPMRADAPGMEIYLIATLFLPIAVAWLFFRVATRHLLLPPAADEPSGNAIRLR